MLMRPKKITLTLVLFVSIFLWGSGIWIFDFIPSVLKSGEDFRFVLTRHFFFYLQILITLTGFVLLHVSIKKTLPIKIILGYFLLATILVQTRFFHQAHEFMKNYNIYFDIFKTSVDGRSVVSFQYARIFMISMVALFAMGTFLFVRRSKLLIFVILYISAFYIFFYFMHLYIGRQVYTQYEKQLSVQMKMILENDNNWPLLCKKLQYQCDIVDATKPYTLSRPQIKNRIMKELDTTEEANKLVTSKIILFNESKDFQKVFMESAIVTDNLRSMVFAFKKQKDEDKVLVVVDYERLSYALDLYLIYFMITINIFMTVWAYGVFWLYEKHKKYIKPKEMGID